ncbi:Cytidine and deoxycytidylate deaminase zinc-binding region [compost metagenome]
MIYLTIFLILNRVRKVVINLERKEKNNYYLDIAQTISERATCLRRKYGAIIVKNDEIISTGYCGSPRNAKNCTCLGSCRRDELNIPSGERYELCRSVHAEMNAIISAARRDMIGSVLYLVGVDAKTGDIVKDAEPCMLCKRVIINAGISFVIIRNTANEFTLMQPANWIFNEQV